MPATAAESISSAARSPRKLTSSGGRGFSPGAAAQADSKSKQYWYAAARESAGREALDLVPELQKA